MSTWQTVYTADVPVRERRTPTPALSAVHRGVGAPASGLRHTFGSVLCSDSPRSLRPSQSQWYVTGGYMDWMGNATAERALSGSDDGRWNYPDLWHTFTIPVSETGETLQIVMVRTRRC